MKQTERTKCLAAFQRYIRVSKANPSGYVKCITCGKYFPWDKVDAGHYIQRSCRATEMEPDNVWPQCKMCNRFKAGDHATYRLNLLLLIGEERVERLEAIHALYMGADLYKDRLTKEDQLKAISRKSKGEYKQLASLLRKNTRELLQQKGLL